MPFYYKVQQLLYCKPWQILLLFKLLPNYSQARYLSQGEAFQ